MDTGLGLPVWAIIPVKSLASSKSRLGVLLSPAERALLTQCMLAHVVSTLKMSAVVDTILVVSSDETVRELAPILGALWTQDTAGELNGAIELGMRKAAGKCSAFLVLPSDLPRIREHDVRMIVDRWREGHQVVICPSSNGGTNGLLIDASVKMTPSFGPDSFARHLALARMAGARVAVVATSSLSFDLDMPEHWFSLTNRERKRLLLGLQVSTSGHRRG